MLTIYEALKKDHVVVLDLLDQLMDASITEGPRKRLLTQIRNELIPHARAEEAVFYNSLREIDATKGMAFHGYREHFEAESLLRALQLMEVVDVNWTRGVRKLKAALEQHIYEEEHEIIPAAQKLFIQKEAEMMAEAFTKMKAEVKDGSFVESTLDMVANLMPDRLREPLKRFTHQPHI